MTSIYLCTLKVLTLFYVEQSCCKTAGNNYSTAKFLYQIYQFITYLLWPLFFPDLQISFFPLFIIIRAQREPPSIFLSSFTSRICSLFISSSSSTNPQSHQHLSGLFTPFTSVYSAACFSQSRASSIWSMAYNVMERVLSITF